MPPLSATAPRHLLAAHLLLLAGCASAATQVGPPIPAWDHPGDSLPYHRRQDVACHNCYEPKPPFLDFGAALDRTRSVEIDFRYVPRGKHAGRWVASHGKDHSHSNCAPPGRDGDLAACLRRVADRLRADPLGDVFTVFMDLKGEWEEAGEGSPASLDRLLRSAMPEGRIYTPAKLAAKHDSPASAAREDAWPRMGELHGQVIFVLTGDNKRLDRYLEAAADSAALFVASNAATLGEVEGLPDIGERRRDQVVFFNIPLYNPFAIGAAKGSWLLREREPIIRAVRERRGVSRLWYLGADWIYQKKASCLYTSGLNFLAVFKSFKRPECPGT